MKFFLISSLIIFCINSFSQLSGIKQLHQEKQTIKHIHIVGERHSGTNFIANLLAANIEGITVSNQLIVGRYGWKHGFVKDEKLVKSENCLFVHVYRNAYDWIRSLHSVPYHAHKTLHNLPFSKFIRTEWQCTNDKGTEMLEERDPDTGNRFENVLKLRIKKLKHFENLKTRIVHFCPAPYEIVNKNPINFLQNITKTFNLRLKKKYIPITRDGYKQKIYKKKIYPPIKPEDLIFINDQLDWDFEKTLGYKLNEAETCYRNILEDELTEIDSTLIRLLQEAIAASPIHQDQSNNASNLATEKVE